MAKDSSIEWTHHTFNPWWGCTKVSPGCKNCYAETFSRRIGQHIWGPSADRRFFGDAHWREPIKWNSEAARAGADRKSTRLNSSHGYISYAVFCLKKKKRKYQNIANDL